MGGVARWCRPLCLALALAGCGGIEPETVGGDYLVTLVLRGDGLPDQPPWPVCPGAKMPAESPTTLRAEGLDWFGAQTLCGAPRGLRLTGGQLHAMLDETDEVVTARLQMLPGWIGGPLVNKRGPDGQWRLTGLWLIAQRPGTSHGKAPPVVWP